MEPDLHVEKHCHNHSVKAPFQNAFIFKRTASISVSNPADVY